MMLMMVPLMIWSARTVMHSQACRTDTSIPAAMAATRPTISAGVAPKTGQGVAGGPDCWTIIAAMKPTKALVSIIPSMPMFTTPERSFMIPHSAPSAIGVAI